MSTPESKENEEISADPNGPVNVGHQDNDLDLKTVKKFLIGSFAVTIAFFILMLVVLKFYKGGFEKERGVATVEERQIPSKSDALLQTQPLVDLAEYNELEASRLQMTTNAVEHAVIPVEAAKKLMLQENAFPSVATAETGTHGLSSMIATETPAPSAPAMVESMVAESAPAAPAPAAAAEAAAPAPAPEPAVDPAMVAAGKVIWETQCMAACHTGKKGAIAPNIQKAFGTMRQIENHDPILMDEAYVLNSLNNPMEHIAKGYMPVMMSFKENLSSTEKDQVVAYLKSMGKPIVKAAPAPTPAPVAAPEPTSAPEPVQQEQTVPVETVPAPAPAPVLEPTPAPAAPAPEAPAPAPEKPEQPSGVIFV
ncbi:MAG: c-type cytochrome [Kiritimatiellia bacterium]